MVEGFRLVEGFRVSGLGCVEVLGGTDFGALGFEVWMQEA